MTRHGNDTPAATTMFNPGRTPFRAVLAAAALLAAPAAAAGQGNDRFRDDLVPGQRIEGLSAADASAWSRAVAAVAAVLRAQPDVAAPPDGICTVLHGDPGRSPVDGHMRGAIGVQVSVSWHAQDGCAGLSNEGVTVHLNGTGRFIRDRLTGMRHADWQELHVTPQPAGRSGAATLWAGQYNRWAVITHGRAPLLDTLTHERYLRRRIAELRETGAVVLAAQLATRLDALSPVEREAPACFDVNDLLAALAPCREDGRAHVTLNRAYFDASLPPGAVQLIVVSSPQQIRGKEDPRHFALRTRIFEALDLNALAELVHR